MSKREIPLPKVAAIARFLDGLGALLEAYPDISLSYTTHDDGVYVDVRSLNIPYDINLGFNDQASSARGWAAALREYVKRMKRARLKRTAALIVSETPRR